MLISVVIPFYNSEKWLPRCLKSLESNEGDFEFILINDSSTDRSRELVEACSDDRIVLIDNEHTKGVSGARNTGIEHAKGEYVTFLDADDTLLPNAYNTYSKVAQSGVCQLNHMRQYKSTKIPKYVNDAGTYTPDKPPLCWWAVWNKLIKRELLEGIRFDESLNYGEDAVFMLELLSKESNIHHGSATIICRHFDNPNSLAASKTLEDVIKQVRAIEARMLTYKPIRELARQHIVEIWTTKQIVELVRA